jgi:hypothetical protein
MPSRVLRNSSRARGHRLSQVHSAIIRIRLEHGESTGEVDDAGFPYFSWHKETK